MDIVIPPDAFLIGTDLAITIQGVKDEDEVAVNDATFLGDLFTDELVAVPGAVDIPFEYITGSVGNYRGVLDGEVVLTEKAKYIMILVATSGGRRLTLRMKRTARYIDI